MSRAALPIGHIARCVAAGLELRREGDTMPETRKPPIDAVEWGRKREQFPDELLQPHWGRHAAFNADASQIIASAKTRSEVFQMLDQMGVDAEQVVIEFINDPNVSYL
jgi:hypothetical protein